jgi:arginase
VRLGNGPDRLLDEGLVEMLNREGHEVAVLRIGTTAGFATEVGTSFALSQGLARDVGSARESGDLPLILSGNCFVALGTISGLDPSRLGIVWFDAHGEYNTPESTVTGCLDGMGLAAATGDCWQVLAAGIPGFAPVPQERIVLVGARDFDRQEEARLTRSRLVVVGPNEIANRGVAAALAPAFAKLKEDVSQVYLHFDMDVLDPSEAHANELAVEGGLTVQEVEEAVTQLRACCQIAGVGVAGFDPNFDSDGRAARAAFRIIAAVLRA